jgi:hypothetical protein
MIKSAELKRILIEDIRVYRGQVKHHPLAIEYDFNKEGYKDDISGERFYLVRARYNGRLSDGLEYLCLIKFRCFTDDDYSKMKTNEALAKLTRKINSKYYNPEKGILKLAINEAVTMMSKYTDKHFASQEAAQHKL